MKGDQLSLCFVARGELSTNRPSNGPEPACSYVNVHLLGTKPRGGSTGSTATVLLENPHGSFLDTEQLKHQVSGLASNTLDPKFETLT